MSKLGIPAAMMALAMLTRADTANAQLATVLKPVQLGFDGFATFIEARYNRISENGGSTSFVPVTFGVMF